MWFKFDATMPSHPKTVRMCRVLKEPLPVVVGYLAMFWGWAMHHAPDGVISDDPLDVEFSIGWTGDAGAFVSAMLECGLLDKRGAGEVEIHNWWDRAGSLKAAQTKRKQREAGAAKGPGPSVYILRRPSDGAIKIGHSVDPYRRKKEHSWDHGEDLELLGYFPGTRDDEIAAHSMLESDRIGVTEWFRPTAETLGWVSGTIGSSDTGGPGAQGPQGEGEGEGEGEERRGEEKRVRVRDLENTIEAKIVEERGSPAVFSGQVFFLEPTRQYSAREVSDYLTGQGFPPTPLDLRTMSELVPMLGAEVLHATGSARERSTAKSMKPCAYVLGTIRNMRTELTNTGPPLRGYQEPQIDWEQRKREQDARRAEERKNAGRTDDEALPGVQ